MSAWTHATCDRCWTAYNPDREPARLVEPEVEVCCYCGAGTVSGIYTREDPASEHVFCEGNHPGMAS